MRNFYHYRMAMFYMWLAHLQPANSEKWGRYIDKSFQHIRVVLDSVSNK